MGSAFAPGSGWVAVLVSLVAATFIPGITMGITAFCLPRSVTKNSDGHWAERARCLFSFKAVRIYSLSLLPVIYAIGGNLYPHSIMPIPRWTFCSLIFLATFVSTNWATPLLYIPLMKVLLVFLENPERGLPLLALCPVIMAGFRFLSRRRRRMEVRAVFGSLVYEDKGIYARALRKVIPSE
jgi:hypothetical protein